MGEILVVNKEMVIPLHSFELDSAFVSSFRAWPMYRIILALYFEYFRPFTLFCISIMICPWLLSFKVLWILIEATLYSLT